MRNNGVSQMREYFDSRRDIPLYNKICRQDNNYTPLHLADLNFPNIRYPTLERLAMYVNENLYTVGIP